jgi:RHS repeat-associated protein
MAGGSATPMSVNLDMLKNRINTAGWNYDNNGNTVAMPTSGGYAALEYDADNRLTKWTGPAGEENYRYLPDNKRVWKKAPGGAETVYFYGVGGQKLITYTLQTSPVALVSPVENVYFGGKLIRANGVSVVHDRLGSVVARGDSSSSVITKHDYLPYGEEMGTATGGNVDKFGTYLRDQTTGLDYADQRYFAGTGAGRFLSSDPYEASGGAGEPGSWNRFAYVGGDPVNKNDTRGLECVWVTTGIGSGNWASVGNDGCTKAGVNVDNSIANSHSIVVQSNWWLFSPGMGGYWDLPMPELPDELYVPTIIVGLDGDTDRENREREECYRNVAAKTESDRLAAHEWIEEEFSGLKSAGGSALKWGLWGATQGARGELSVMVGFAVRGAAGAVLGGFVGATLAFGGAVIAAPVFDPIMRSVAIAAADSFLDFSETVANSHCAGAPLMPALP